MLDVGNLSSALALRGASWSAAPSRLSSLPADQLRALAGALDVPIEHALRQASGSPPSPHTSSEMPPQKVDWRDKNGNFVSSVRDQGLCRSCVAFATCAVMESRLRINEQKPGLDFQLAPGPLFFCGHSEGCSAGRYATDIMAVARNGVGLEAAAPYSAEDPTCRDVPASLKITAIQQCIGGLRARKFFVDDEGPVYAEMRLFDDFVAYKSGVYHHLQGEDRGLHAVVIIGYDDTENCWIGLNSWGPDMQDGGFFKIGYGECEIDTRPFIALDVERVKDATV